MDGVLLVDKPVGASSNAVLQGVRRTLGAAKAGHGGTLDPLASGLLVVLFGEATKFAGPMLEADKEYLATLKLGQTTSTADAEGEILQTRPVSAKRAQVDEAIEKFKGAIEQVPPMYSALKRDGVPLYKLARRGETVERKARSVEIRELECLALEDERLELRVRCSKGTYIRTLAEDIGEALGCGAHLSALRRTGSGTFRVEDALTPEALAGDPQATKRLLPLSVLISGLPQVSLDAASVARLRQGQALRIDGLAEGLCGVCGPGGEVIGLAQAAADGSLRAVRLTRSESGPPKDA